MNGRAWLFIGGILFLVFDPFGLERPPIDRAWGRAMVTMISGFAAVPVLHLVAWISAGVIGRTTGNATAKGLAVRLAGKWGGEDTVSRGLTLFCGLILAALLGGKVASFAVSFGNWAWDKSPPETIHAPVKDFSFGSKYTSRGLTLVHPDYIYRVQAPREELLKLKSDPSLWAEVTVHEGALGFAWVASARVVSPPEQ